MPLKDILVHLDATDAAPGRIDVAATLAAAHDAHLTGLHVMEVSLPFAAGDEGSASALPMLMARIREEARTAADRNEAAFLERGRRDGLRVEWRALEGTAVEEVVRHGRLADLVVIGQDAPDGGNSSTRAVIEAALFSSGRPILIVPYAGSFPSIGRRVVIGWNGSREAARAVNDALPLIAMAETATVLCVNPSTTEGEPGADLAVHLTRHGLNVDLRAVSVSDIAESDAMLNEVADLGADMLVIGGYGHSRMREMMFGGVTRGLLRQMSVPVFMSH